MIYQEDFIHSGSFKKILPSTVATINYKFNIVNNPVIPCNKSITLPLCMKGCKNYNTKYSCPPFSPDFNKFPAINKALFLALYIDTNTFNLDNKLFKLNNCNRTIVPILNKIGYKMEDMIGGTLYKAGACKLCQKCTASLSPPQPCKHPDKKRFSLESCGTLVNELSEKYLSHKLLWYHKTSNPDIPYTSVVSAIINPTAIEALDIESILQSIEGVTLL